MVALTLACVAPRGPARELASVAPAPVIAARVAAAVLEAADPVEEELAAARSTLGETNPRLDGEKVPTDCSGYLRALYARAGLDLFSEERPGDNGVRAILRFVERYGRFDRAPRAAPGDLVFFDNTYDRNGDGRLNDRLTHAGLVEQVLSDGTMLIVHATNHGIVREAMNLAHPHEAGATINAPLRRKGARDGARTPHLMAELFAGFGRIFHRERLAQVAPPPDP